MKRKQFFTSKKIHTETICNYLQYFRNLIIKNEKYAIFQQKRNQTIFLFTIISLDKKYIDILNKNNTFSKLIITINDLIIIIIKYDNNDIRPITKNSYIRY